MMAQRSSIEATGFWLPYFKLLGLGLALIAIVMALGAIAKKLRRMGFVISSHIPEGLRPNMPPIPKRVRVFQLLTLMGVMTLLAALVIGAVVAGGRRLHLLEPQHRREPQPGRGWV